MITALTAALCAVGVVMISTGAYRLRQRAATSRRVAEMLGPQPRRAYWARPGRLHVTWHFDARQALAQLEAHDNELRGPVTFAAGVCGIIGLASLSPIWFMLMLSLAGVAYALGARQRRRGRIEAQALDAVGLFASGLRAGYSVGQSIELVSKHSPEPTASEFALAAQEISVGIDLPQAIARLAKRTANKDYELVAIIVRVQHEVGGNLAQILDSAGDTLRERFELRRQVNALTAQQRLSSIVLTVLPFALLTFLFVMDRSFVDPLFSQTLGRLILAGAGAMVFVGWTFMRSIGRVEV